jgi:DNA-binding NarL/FixJ family response regulator
MQILLADDQSKVRSALRLLLRQQPDVNILGEAVDAQGLLDWVSAVCPDVVLLDWELPGLHGSDALSILQTRCPNLKIIALSGRPEAREAALAAGADAFVSKGSLPEQLLATVHTCYHRQRTRGKER